MNNETTLEELRLNWEAIKKGDGGHCAVCRRWGKIYPRGINSTMAKSLIWIASKNSDEWIDVPNTGPTWVLRSNQLPTLRWWDMVERNDSKASPENKHAGMWRATEFGRMFAQNKVTAPDKVFTYNGEVVAKSIRLIPITDCFGVKFNYREVFDSFGNYLSKS